MSADKSEPASRQAREESQAPPDGDECPFTPAELYTIDEVCGVLKISRKSWYRKSAAGLLPGAVRFRALGPRIPGAVMAAWYRRQTDRSRD